MPRAHCDTEISVGHAVYKELDAHGVAIGERHVVRPGPHQPFPRRRLLRTCVRTWRGCRPRSSGRGRCSGRRLGFLRQRLCLQGLVELVQLIDLVQRLRPGSLSAHTLLHPLLTHNLRTFSFHACSMISSSMCSISGGSSTMS